MTAFENRLRQKVLRAIEVIEELKFFIHSETLRITLEPEKTYELPSIATLAVLNAIVPRGSMLLYGGYGGGKTTLVKLLGRLLTGLSIRKIEESIIRAHPQLTEEKMVGRLDVGKLLKEGAENIVWRNFILSFWKIIDEVNRLSPGAQDAIFSILSEGIAKYFDGIYETKNYVLYATINPRDTGTYPLGLPFLDRFGIAVPISSPSFDEISALSDVPDDKLHEFDDIRVPALLSVDELMIIWHLTSRIPLSEEAKLFISALSREFSLCIRTKKELGTFLQYAESICRGCHFNTENAVCNKVFTPLSVRSSKDLARYSKALAWLLGLDKVPLGIVSALAPYVVWHRLSLSPKYLERFYNDGFNAAKQLVDDVLRNFIRRLPLYQGFMNLEEGSGDLTIIHTLKESAPSDLIVAADLYPNAELISMLEYQQLVKDLKTAIKDKDISRLEKVLNEAKEKLSPGVRGRFLRVYERMLKQNRRVFQLSFKEWLDIAPRLTKALTDSKDIIERLTKEARLEKIHLNHGDLILHTTGIQPNAPVFIEIYGIGEIEDLRKKIIEILEK